MRLLASLTVAAALAVSAVPADAYKKTVRVPLLNCHVTVETWDVYVGVDGHGRNVRVERWGEGDVNTNC